MCSISSGQINQQFGRYKNVSVWRFRQQAFPVPLWDRVIPTPLSRPLFGNSKIGSHLLPTPRFNNFREILHSLYCGALPHYCQGAKPQCFTWLNRGKYPL